MKLRKWIKISGVYLIKSKHDGKCYVGSGVNIYNRWSNHITLLGKGTHPNQKLQRAWRKYGPASFEFSVLELCEVESLISREQFWMDALFAVSRGYNLQPKARSCLGSKRSSETRAKMSAKAKAAANTPEQRELRSARAKRQHAEGKLGQATWSTKTRLRVQQKPWFGKSNAMGLAALAVYWANPENRVRASRRQREFALANPAEMSRRSRLQGPKRKYVVQLLS